MDIRRPSERVVMRCLTTSTTAATGSPEAPQPSSVTTTRTNHTSHRVSSGWPGQAALRALLNQLLAKAGFEITRPYRPYTCPLCGSTVLPVEKGDTTAPDSNPATIEEIAL